MKKNRFEVILFGIFAAVGICLLIAAVIFTANQMKFFQNAVPVEGTISRIDSHRDSDGDTSYSARVTYSFQGKEYKNISIGYYTSSMYEGQKIELYCDPENPANMKVKATMAIGLLVLGILGVVFTLVGVLPLLFFARKARLRRKLQQSGRALYAEVEGVELNTSYSVNGRHPYILYCHYKDPYSDVTYRFKSDNLWTDPTPYFPIGAEVTVRVMEGRYDIYHVEAEKVLDAKVVDYT